MKKSPICFFQKNLNDVMYLRMHENNMKWQKTTNYYQMLVVNSVFVCLHEQIKNVEKFTKWKWIFGELNPRECMQVRNYFKT